jgi:hypothetical protein
MSEYYEVLVEHFLESENYGKASKYSRLSERKSEKSGSLDNAIVYAQKMISCLERIPKTEDMAITAICTHLSD